MLWFLIAAGIILLASPIIVPVGYQYFTSHKTSQVSESIKIETSHELKSGDVLARLVVDMEANDDWRDRRIIRNSEVCKNFDKRLNWDYIPVPVIALVKSAINHFDRRKAIRKTWGKPTDFLKLVFLLGKNETFSNKIYEEAYTYGDIVQGNFLDSYRNLTLKTMLGLQWVTRYCPRAGVIMMVDDDTFVHLNELKIFLYRRFKPQSIACKKFPTRLKPPRDRRKENFVSKAVYSAEYFPPFCVGLFVLIRTEVAYQLVAKAKTEKYYMNLDNVFFTGIIRNKLNITIDDIDRLFLQEKDAAAILKEDTSKIIKINKFMFGPWHLQVKDMVLLWNRTEKSRLKRRKLRKEIKAKKSKS